MFVIIIAIMPILQFKDKGLQHEEILPYINFLPLLALANEQNTKVRDWARNGYEKEE